MPDKLTKEQIVNKALADDNLHMESLYSFVEFLAECEGLTLKLLGQERHLHIDSLESRLREGSLLELSQRAP